MVNQILRRDAETTELWQGLERDPAMAFFLQRGGLSARSERAGGAMAGILQGAAMIALLVGASELAPGSAPTSETAAAFDPGLYLCPRTRVANAPAADEARRVRDYAPLVNVNGVVIASAPARGACLSSSFGVRGSSMHKGLDLHAHGGGPILAAGAGVVIERLYRNDYGNMLLIDHGAGVYTRYAHLSSFAENIEIGAQVSLGQQIGMMGSTAARSVHLHYELLLGDYNNSRGSYGLTPRSPFEFPAAN
jgi:murein DD-endopeptidase MepM/ murein hydrolase activator NlpD